MDWDELQCIVIDNGSTFIKVGYAGDDGPREVFPSCVERRKVATCENLEAGSTDSIGDENEISKIYSPLYYPIERGVVLEWGEMEQLWNKGFNRMNRNTDERSVVLVDHSIDLTTNRIMMTKILFENFHVPGLYIAHPTLLSLYAAGNIEGVVLWCGGEVTTAIAVYGGFIISYTVQSMDIGGNNLTKYLRNLLQEKGYQLTSETELDIVREMKEKLCYIALDVEKEVGTEINTEYSLPDGNVIELAEERFMCPEALFQPSLLGNDSPGVHELIFNAIMKFPKDIRKVMYENIIIAGGSTMFEGFVDRVYKEVKSLSPDVDRIKVIGTPERKYSSWIGGSILGSISSFDSMSISKAEYNEFGPSIIHKKCF